MFCCMHFWLNFRDGFEQLFESFSQFFRSARKRPRREKCNTFHTKTYFSKVRPGAGAARTAKKNCETLVEKQQHKYRKIIIFCFFSCGQALQQECCQNHLPETLRDPPGELPGTPRVAQDGPRSRQERPKMAPRAAKSAPRASKRAPGNPSGSPWGPRGRPEVSREHFWSHFGSIFERFLNHS